MFIKDCTISNQLVVEALTVSAGENLVMTLPENQVDLKALVVRAPPAGESLTSLRDSRGRWAGRSSPVFTGYSPHRERSRLKAESADEALLVISIQPH